jgi:hypothetical protein
VGAVKLFEKRHKGAGANEKNVLRVDHIGRVAWNFSCSSGLNVDFGAFKNFQKGLLDPFAANVACDGRARASFGDFIDLVNKNNAALCFVDVAIGRLQEPLEARFDIFADLLLPINKM